MTKAEMTKISESAPTEKLLEWYGMHTVIIATSDIAELKERAEMANDVIKAELLSRVTK